VKKFINLTGKPELCLHMKSIILFLISIVLLLQPALADEFIVKSFYEDPNDLAARQNPKKDVNDEFCAIIKLKTDLQ